MKKWLGAILLVYTGLLIDWMFFGFGRSHYHFQGYQYNLIPFRTIRLYLERPGSGLHALLINVVGNIAAFVPFGLLIPGINRRKLRYGPFAWGMAVFILLLETAQMLSLRGRFDMDDLILNLVGASAGYGIWRIWTRPGRVRDRSRFAVTEKQSHGDVQ